MRIPWPHLWLLAGAAAVSLFTAALLLLSNEPADAMVRLATGLTALILAAFLVHAVLAERGRRRTDEKLAALAKAITDHEAGVEVRFRQLIRDSRVDRMYFRDVLQDLGVKMDGISRLELQQFEVLRDMNDTGEHPLPLL